MLSGLRVIYRTVIIEVLLLAWPSPSQDREISALV